MKNLISALLILPLLGGCQADGSSPISAYVQAEADAWVYTDGQHIAAVGSGLVDLDLMAYGLAVQAPVDLGAAGDKAWFKAPGFERTQEISEPWPNWMATKVRLEDTLMLEAKYGITITFELPSAPEAPLATE